MHLDKDDLKQIEKIVDKRAQQTEVILEDKLSKKVGKIVDGSAEETRKSLKQEFDFSIKKEINDATKEIKDFVGTEIENLAIMTKHGFDSVDDRFAQMDKRFDKLEKGQQQIRRDVSNLEFISTEMVRRDEFLELKQRFTKIEAKVGSVK